MLLYTHILYSIISIKNTSCQIIRKNPKIITIVRRFIIYFGYEFFNNPKIIIIIRKFINNYFG